MNTPLVVHTTVKEWADLRAAKSAMKAEQRKHAKARARIAELKGVLQRCADAFRFYEAQHLAKKPPDIDKATTNRMHAEEIEALLK